MSGSAHKASGSTQTRPVLIVEDETLVAMLLEDMLEDLGFGAVNVVAHVDDALRCMQDQNYSFAILDVDLNGQSSLPVADALRERGVPFFFSTGYGAGAAGENYADIPTLRKPFRMVELQSAIAQLSLPDMPPGLNS